MLSNSWGANSHVLAMDAAIAAVTSAGGLVFCSAGNEGANVDNKQHYPSSYSETNSQVVSVGASDANGNLWSRSNYGVKGGVTLAAPGVSVLGLGLAGTYVRNTGTSMSSKSLLSRFYVRILCFLRPFPLTLSFVCTQRLWPPGWRFYSTRTR